MRGRTTVAKRLVRTGRALGPGPSHLREYACMLIIELRGTLHKTTETMRMDHWEIVVRQTNRWLTVCLEYSLRQEIGPWGLIGVPRSRNPVMVLYSVR